MHLGACSTILRRFAGPEANELAILCRPDARSPDTVHQAEAAYRALAALLAEQGATFADLVSGVAYLKNPTDAPILQSLFRHRGFDGFPCALVEARLCRPQLLCEAEAIAILPPAAGT